MRDSRVNELALTIHAPEQPPEALESLRRRTEHQFMMQLLETCERAVARAYGGDARLFCRRIDAHWSVREDEIDDREVARSLGEELGEVVIARFARKAEQHLWPAPDADIALFVDEQHLAVARLSWEATRGGTAPWFLAQAMREPEPWTSACAAGATAVARLVSWVARHPRAELLLRRAPRRSLVRAAELLPPSEWPLPAPLRQIVVEVVAEETSPEDAATAAVATGSTAAAATTDGHDATDDTAAPAAAPGPGHRIEVATGRASAPPSRAGGRPAAAGVADASEPIAVDASPGSLVQMRFAGVFYLAARALEIDLPEHLYCAGLLEGHVLCHAARALIRDGDDLAPRVFGGTAIDRDPPLAPVPAWAVDEVMAKTAAAVSEWLPRIGHQETPPAEVSSSLERIGAAIGGWIVDGTTTRLVRGCAAALAYAFFARLGKPVDLDLLAAILAVPGRIDVAAPELSIALPMSAVDIDLRLAGLDFDPGFLPWLRKAVKLTFGDEG